MSIGWAKWLLGALLSIWVSIGVAMHLLLVMMALDFGSGVLCAVRRGDLSSHVSFMGLLKKIAILVVVGTAYLLQHALQAIDGVRLVIDLGQMVALVYVWNESISIIENCACMGAPIPEALKRLLATAPKMTKSTEKG